ncbi:MAG: VanZ family protein [Candidatus Aminicenantes bacterium]|nr:VanZ family protein [Candidatus Aminicenantes bacterium]
MRSKLNPFLPAGLYYGLIFFLSAQPNVRLPAAFPLIDKALHLVLYAGFGVCLAYGTMKTAGLRDRPAVVPVLGAVLACLDEVHQMFVPGRSAEILDVLVDVLGLAAGWGIARMIARSRHGRRFFAPDGPGDKAPQPWKRGGP